MRGATILVTMGLGVGLASLTATHAARACFRLAPELALPNSAAAPRNAHVWVRGAMPELNAGATFALVAPGSAEPPPLLDMRQWVYGELFELVPRAPLAAGARYDLWARPHKAPWAPNGAAAPSPVLLGTFRTGTGTDTTPPAAPAVRNAILRPQAASCRAALLLQVAPDVTPGGGVLYAVWIGDRTGHIAYETPPTELASIEQVSFDRSESTLELLAAPKTGSRVGVRALDEAGNLSDPVERTVIDPPP